MIGPTPLLLAIQRGMILHREPTAVNFRLGTLTRPRDHPSIPVMTTFERFLSDGAARHRIFIGAGVLVALGAAAIVFVHPLIAVAVFAGLIVAPFVLRDIDLAFLAVVTVITLLPFGAIPIGIGFNPTFLDLALGALYLIWAVRIATREELGFRWPPLSAGVLLFIGLAVAALLAGLTHGTPTKNQFRTFGELIMAAGLFFVIGHLIRDRASLRRVFLALVGLGFVAACLGLGLYLLPHSLQVTLLSLLRVVDYPSGPAVLRYINDDPSRLQRATGTSIDPNSFGGMLAVVTALLLPQLTSRAPLIPRRTAAFMLLVMLGALLATVSRGSLFGLAAAVVVIGLVRDRRLLASGVLGLAGLVALARVVPWTAAYVDHFTAGFALADRATQMRLGEYKDALRLIRRYPVFGVGFGSVRDVDLYRGVSSLYLIIPETMGLVGLAAFLAVAGGFAARIGAAWRAMAPDGLRAVVLGCLAALAAALASGVFDHYFFTYPHAFALLWLVIGLAMSAIRLVDDGRAAPGLA